MDQSEPIFRALRISLGRLESPGPVELDSRTRKDLAGYRGVSWGSLETDSSVGLKLAAARVPNRTSAKKPASHKSNTSRICHRSPSSPMKIGFHGILIYCLETSEKSLGRSEFFLKVPVFKELRRCLPNRSRNIASVISSFCRGQRVLLRAGSRIPLTPKPLGTLLLLVARAGQTVTKEELLRRSLERRRGGREQPDAEYLGAAQGSGEKRGENRYIVTDPSRGYRFVAPVSHVREEAAASAPPRGRDTQTCPWRLADYS